MHIGEPALELDAAKRKFKLLFACLAFGDTIQTAKAVTSDSPESVARRDGRR